MKSKRYEVRLEGAKMNGTGRLLASYDDYNDAREHSYQYNCSNQPEFQDAWVVDTKAKK